MDYYTQLSQKAKERTAKHLQKIAEIEKTLTAAIKNLDSEKSAEKSLSGHIERLKARSSDFLTDDKMSFERFKKDLRKNAVDLEISQESIRILEGIILPEKRKLLESTQKDLELTLRILTTETVAVAEKVIGDLLRQAEAERESFIDAVKKMHEDYGLTFVFNDERLVPGAWPASEQLELKPAIGIQTVEPEVAEPVIREFEKEIDSVEPAMSPGKGRY